MPFGPFDFILALSPKNQRRALLFLGVVIASVSPLILLQERSLSVRIAELICTAVLWLAISTLSYLGARR